MELNFLPYFCNEFFLICLVIIEILVVEDPRTTPDFNLVYI